MQWGAGQGALRLTMAKRGAQDLIRRPSEGFVRCPTVVEGALSCAKVCSLRSGGVKVELSKEIRPKLRSLAGLGAMAQALK